HPLVAHQTGGEVPVHPIGFARDFALVERVQELRRRCRPEDALDVGSTELETMRHAAQRRAARERVFVECAATLPPRRPRLPMPSPAIEYADPARSEGLVRAEHEEIAAELLDVDRKVRERLRTVDDEQGATSPAELRELADRLYDAGYVRCVRDGYDRIRT